jgi:hypothetical protein
MSFLKSLFGNGAENLAREIYPAPDANGAQYQKEALDDLQKGITPTGYSLAGYLCKKGEKVIFSFNGVTHYCSAVHSEWAGRSAGTSVRIAKGFWIRTGANRGHSAQHTSMQRQGGGCLVLTNQGLSFVSKEKSARILLSHMQAVNRSMELSSTLSLDGKSKKSAVHVCPFCAGEFTRTEWIGTDRSLADAFVPLETWNRRSLLPATVVATTSR